MNVAELPSLAITIVTYNSARYIRECLESVWAQQYPALQVTIVDNASADGTRQILKTLSSRCDVVFNAINNGFAGGQNQAMARSRSKWILALNPDVRMTPDFLRNLVLAGEADPQAGTVCGKLLSLEAESPPRFDSTGIYLTPELRHLDRGSRQPDDGRYDRWEYVFGATGAAALYRRAMVEDVSVYGQFFDEDFFAYREDADVSWRAQLFGWRCLYCPAAVARHVRSVVPENRRAQPAAINMHSVKNRWLLRMNNMTAGVYRRFWFPISWRDAIVIGGCLLRERSSLPGFWFVIRNWRRLWRKRQAIQARRKATDESIAQWIAREPVRMPAPAEIEQRFERSLLALTR